ncbi:putative lipoprotein [Leptospira inadai serovar Lyme str. 10]|uniref:Lipoprotein n=2 Tax=Leptospira inadai serovar Lyme TaxID=293084 RepID=A0ABX4YJ72_9LEPT|nr:hypothetical protein [Leptospira inadai]EQA38632.1 putative lipoprotein [Leptospira inadai serovar Lyme str. 10]PNV75195.1 hypothetical protein BES34_009945 [Leptospira inadai serovar Lyme]
MSSIKHAVEVCRFLVLLVSVVFGSACRQESEETNPYMDLFNTSPLTESGFYKDRAPSWEFRVFPLDVEAKNFVTALNRIDGFEEVPSSSGSWRIIAEEVKSLKKELPNSINKLLTEFLFRIYVCENLGGSAVSGFVYRNGHAIGGFVILDSQILNKNANDWISYKENSAFKPGNTAIKIKIEEENSNTKVNALRYILLHEFGHILSVATGIGPDLRGKTRKFESLPFYHGIWKSEKKSVYDDSQFKFRSRIKFYSSSLALQENWNNIYPILEKTPFPTLYSATNADDFFAESFVSYVHVIMQKRPWQLIIYEKGKPIYQTKNGIEKESLEKQRRMIETIINRADP